jgi:hypothetical protein
MVSVTEEPLVSRNYPLTTVMTARSLYLGQGLQPLVIAERLGLEVETVYCWARIHGWAKARQEAQLASPTPDNIRETVKLELESASLRSAALVGQTLSLAEVAAGQGKIRDVMFAASAAKTLADLASKHSGNDAASPVNVNLSFSLDSLYRASDTPLNVTPEKPALPAP